MQSGFDKNCDMNFEITVGLPPSYASQEGKTYPVMIVLDGGVAFSTAFDSFRAQSGTGSAEEVIVVGVDTPPEEGNAMRGLKRLRYLTPGCPHNGPNIQPILKMYKEAIDQLGWGFDDIFGGADSFLTFIEKSLIPALSDRYSINQEDIGLFGHSAAAAFAVYALLENSPVFSRYAIGTFGTEWWDDIDAAEKTFIENRQSKTDVAVKKVYHAVGGAELEEPAFAGAGIGLPMVDRLRDLDLPGIHISTQVFDGEDHASVIPHVIATGIRKLYGTGLGFAEGLNARMDNAEEASL
ncbi:alpha/beta hydrolase [Pseudomaricurvus alkylphenolicus]|uniref:alpha/beta hydrolase n=1 Tax=Pseudomaricurvus alkylphenolicus TaxID=1306991 RepID=UPI00141E6606|nr:alpha/beta hydrolase-fold protein [Pseudomaricurvus alkylphenolicus]NIB41593.1 alpha/beta hydrolase [Pseudomaricurvus alkylphenolicus]